MHDYKDALREVLHQVYRNTDDFEMRISKDCYKLIIEALEKQIPKKVTKSACPSCNRIFLFRHSEKIKGDYCDNCGQALDWSDTNA